MNRLRAALIASVVAVTGLLLPLPGIAHAASTHCDSTINSPDACQMEESGPQVSAPAKVFATLKFTLASLAPVPEPLPGHFAYRFNSLPSLPPHSQRPANTSHAPPTV